MIITLYITNIKEPSISPFVLFINPIIKYITLTSNKPNINGIEKSLLLLVLINFNICGTRLINVAIPKIFSKLLNFKILEERSLNIYKYIYIYI